MPEKWCRSGLSGGMNQSRVRRRGVVTELWIFCQGGGGFLCRLRFLCTGHVSARFGQRTEHRRIAAATAPMLVHRGLSASAPCASAHVFFFFFNSCVFGAPKTPPGPEPMLLHPVLSLTLDCALYLRLFAHAFEEDVKSLLSAEEKPG